MNPQAANYWPEPCAYCDGTGTMPAFLRQALKAHGLAAQSLGIKESAIGCVACRGKALVLVLKPRRQCAHCQGTGRHCKRDARVVEAPAGCSYTRSGVKNWR